MNKKSTLNKLLTPICVLGLSCLLVGFLPPKHSSLKIEAGGKKEFKQGESVEFNFVVVPNENMQVTPEGPWKLTIKN